MAAATDTGAGSVDRWRIAVRVVVVTGIVVALVAIRVLAYRRVGVDDDAYFAYASLAPVAYLVPGVVLMSRRNGHVIGWLLCLQAMTLGIGFSTMLGVSAVAAGEAWLVWLLAVCEGLTFPMFTALMVVFPDGLAAQAPRHRRVGRVALAAAVAMTALLAFVEQVGVAEADDAVLPSPLPFAFVPRGVADGGVTLALGFGALVVALVGLVVRYRGSHAVVRRQYRWVLWSLAMVIVAFVVGLVGSAFGGGDWPWLPIQIAFVAVPVAFMVAILRYRLYEIDRLVSRSVSYAVLTVLLAAVYAAIAVVPAVVSDVRSDLLVAAATLAAAAVFHPLRRRVQTAVDSRFNRTRYDAARAAEAFTTRLRGATDLADLERDLHTVLRRTVQPAHVALWLASSHE